MDIYLIYVLLCSAKGNIKIPKLLRHLLEKYESLDIDIDIFLNILDMACAKEGCIINQKLVLNMLDKYKDSQRMKAV